VSRVGSRVETHFDIFNRSIKLLKKVKNISNKFWSNVSNNVSKVRTRETKINYSKASQQPRQQQCCRVPNSTAQH